MNLKSPVVVGLAALLVLTLVLHWNQSRRVRSLEETVAVVTRERDEAQARIATAEEERTALQDEVLASRRASGPQPIPSAGRSIAGSAPVPRSQPSPLDEATMQRSIAAGIRGSLDARYASLFRRLQLPSAELEKLKDLLVDRQAAAFDVMAAARSEGMIGPEHSGGIQELVQQTQTEIDRQIRDLLGEESFNRFQDHQTNAQHYAFAEQLERRLSYTDAPLAPHQMEELVQIMKEHTPAALPAAPAASNTFVTSFAGPAGPRFVATSMMGGGAPIGDEAINRASSILTPSQLDALKQLQSEQKDQQAMRMPMPLRSGVEQPAMQFAPAPR